MTREHYGNDYNDVNNGYVNNDASYDRVAERKKKYRRRKVIRRRIIASIIMALIVALVLFVVSLFIRVKEITITGNLGSYSYEEIVEASGIEQGDKLLYINKKSVKNEIEKTLPYMINVKVKKRLFSKAIIEVDFSSEALALYIDGKYVVVDNTFKALRFEDNAEQLDLVKVIGFDSDKVALGETVEVMDKARIEHYQKLYNGLQAERFGEIDFIDVTDIFGLKVGFKNGLEIKFGNYTNLDYNIKWATSVLAELEKKHDEVNGTLDLSVFKKAYYTPRSGEEEPVSVTQ